MKKLQLLIEVHRETQEAAGQDELHVMMGKDFLKYCGNIKL